MRDMALAKLFELAGRMNMDLVKDYDMESPRQSDGQGGAVNPLIVEQMVRVIFTEKKQACRDVFDGERHATQITMATLPVTLCP